MGYLNGHVFCDSLLKRMLRLAKIYTPYYQGARRPVIQLEKPEAGAWIAWNWDTVKWDTIPAELPKPSGGEDLCGLMKSVWAKLPSKLLLSNGALMRFGRPKL
jgi:hypothetical protein